MKKDSKTEKSEGSILSKIIISLMKKKNTDQEKPPELAETP